jgi:Chaperone of endosialidase
MSSIIIAGDVSGSVTLQAPSAAGSTVVNLPSTLGNTSTSSFATTDASGNLGLGVTPSAWDSAFKGVQVGSLAGFYYNGAFGVTEVLNNAYYKAGSSWTYLQNGYANRYDQYNGQHQFYTAPSGTAGSAISFTQAMTLDASNRLMVNTTTPLGRMTVNTPDGPDGYYIQYNGTSQIASFTASAVTGEVKIGATNSVGTFFTTFYSNNSERARIDSSGNLSVGGSSTTSKLNVLYSSTSSGGVYSENSAASPGVDGVAIFANLTNGTGTNSTSAYLFRGRTAGADKFYVYGNGNVVNTNNSYGALSDVKLKENIEDATSKLNGLMQVRVVNYNLIGETQKQIGIVAQELEQVFPSMIDESPDYEKVTTTDENGNKVTTSVATGTTTKSVKYSVFVPMLIKAIQEQQELITSLTERLTALENK